MITNVTRFESTTFTFSLYMLVRESEAFVILAKWTISLSYQFVNLIIKVTIHLMMTFQTCIEEERRKDKLFFREIISDVPFVSRMVTDQGE